VLRADRVGSLFYGGADLGDPTLIHLEKTVRDLPQVNESRVSQIRTAIEQGTYTVRPQHIADQLLSLEHALGHLPDPAESDSPGKSGDSGK